MSTWYLKKPDGSVYGPVELPELRIWATDGRISPEDEVSPDKEAWRAAPDVQDLQMVWLVHLEGTAPFGPLHILALCDLLADESITRETKVTNKKTGSSMIVSEALLTGLVSEIQRLRSEGKEKEGAWEMLVQKERQIAQGKETELKQKLEKARQMQRVLQESVERIERSMKSGKDEGSGPASVDVDALKKEKADLEKRVLRTEKELGEVKVELDLERKRLRDEAEEWRRRLAKREEEKAELEQRLADVESNSEQDEEAAAPSEEPANLEEPEEVAVPSGSPEPVEAEEAVEESSDEEEVEEEDAKGGASDHVVRAATAKMKAHTKPGKKAAPGKKLHLRREGKGFSSNQIRRGPMR